MIWRVLPQTLMTRVEAARKWHPVPETSQVTVIALWTSFGLNGHRSEEWLAVIDEFERTRDG